MKQKLYNIAKAMLAIGVLTLITSMGSFQFSAADSTGGSTSLSLIGFIIAGGLIVISVIIIAIAMSM
ncbi:MAG: hypothetical protein WCW17_00095 [Patescibacteria group bacterium]|jgi:hypothetical protein